MFTVTTHGFPGFWLVGGMDVKVTSMPSRVGKRQVSVWLLLWFRRRRSGWPDALWPSEFGPHWTQALWIGYFYGGTFEKVASLCTSVMWLVSWALDPW